MRDDSGRSAYEPTIRRIVRRNGAPEKIYHKTHGQIFDVLRECIKIRNVPFLKKEAHGGNQDEYIDVQAILSQGTIEVDNELKEKLGNFTIKLFMYFR
jgi:hypothetical protein